MSLICPKCNKPVYPAELAKCVGKSWHKTCVKCKGCEKTLAVHEVNDRKGEIYCKHCFARNFGPVGFGAVGSSYPDQKPVEAGLRKLPVSQGGTGTGVSNESISGSPPPPLKEGSRTASSGKFASFGGGVKCPICNKTVYQAEEVNSCQRKYHKQCFQCFNCKKVLVLGKQNEHDGEPYCQQCYNGLFRIAGYGMATGLSSFTDQKEVADKLASLPVSQGGTGTLTSTGTIKTTTPKPSSSSSGPAKVLNLGGSTVKCPICQKSVYQAEEVSSCGRKYHKQCFQCFNCHKVLVLGKQNEHNGEPYCQPCYNGLFRIAGYGMATGLSSFTDQREVADKLSSLPVSQGGTDTGTNTSSSSPALGSDGSPPTTPPTPSTPPSSSSLSFSLSSLSQSGSTKHYPSLATSVSQGKLAALNLGGGGNKCPVCGKSVYQAEEVSVVGRKYHRLCLQCFNCKKKVELGKQIEHKGEPYCQGCYNGLFRIAGYGMATGLTSYVDQKEVPAFSSKQSSGTATAGLDSTSVGKVSSVSRAYSNVPVSSPPLVTSSGTTSSATAAKLSVFGAGVPKCPNCGKSVYIAEEIKCGRKKYHRPCFRCTRCNNLLILGKQVENKGEPYCQSCYNQLFKIAGYGMATGLTSYQAVGNTSGGGGSSGSGSSGSETANPLADTPADAAAKEDPTAVVVINERSFDAEPSEPTPEGSPKKCYKAIVSVWSGKVYQKQDVAGLGDPYLKIQIGQEVKRTQTNKNTLEPLWKDEFTYDNVSAAAAQTALFSLWDEDAVTKDDFIGSATVSLLHYRNNKTHVSLPLMDGKGVEQAKVELDIVLEGEGEGDGEVAPEEVKETVQEREVESVPVSVQEEPVAVQKEPIPVPVQEGSESEPEPKKEGKSRAFISVLKGKVYHKQDVVGQGDPFLKVKIGVTEKKTQTCKNTLEPQWNDELTFDDVSDADAQTALFTLFDEDNITKDDLIGNATLSLLPFKNNNKQHVSLPLVDGKGEEEATLELDIVLVSQDERTEAGERREGEGEGNGGEVKGAEEKEKEVAETAEESDLQELLLLGVAEAAAAAAEFAAAEKEGQDDTEVQSAESERQQQQQQEDEKQEAETEAREKEKEKAVVTIADVAVAANEAASVEAPATTVEAIEKEKQVDAGDDDAAGTTAVEAVEKERENAAFAGAAADANTDADTSPPSLDGANGDVQDRGIGGGIIPPPLAPPPVLPVLEKEKEKVAVANEVGNKTAILGIVRGKLLKKQDFFGKGDPFVQVSVAGQQSRRTQTAKGTLLPVWNESFSFEHITDTAAQAVVVSLYDEDLFSKNDAIGTATISLQEYLNRKQHITVPVVDRKGTEQALIEVDVLLKEDGAEGTAEGTTRAVINVKSGKVYEKWDVMGKGDPFLVINVGLAEQKTTVKNNTQTPVWNEKLYFENISETDASKIKLSLWDYDKTSNDYIASALVNLLPYRNNKGVISVRLNDEKKKEQATIELEVELKVEG